MSTDQSLTMDRSDSREVTPLRLRLSLFPNVPPYHVFIPYWRSYSDPACPALQEEEWQFPAQIMPVVRDVVAHAGFKVKKVICCDTRMDCSIIIFAVLRAF